MMEELELLRAACCIAGADGTISDRERESLQKMATEVGVGAASFRAMTELAETDPKFREDQLGMVHANPERSFETLYRISRRDPEVPAAERDLLIRFGRKLGLDLDEMNEVIRRVHQQPSRG